MMGISSLSVLPKSLPRKTEADNINTNWKRGLTAFAALCLLLLLRTAGADAPPSPAPINADPHFFDYDAGPFPHAEAPFGTDDGIPITRVTYPSPVVSPYPVNNTVTAYLFLPPGPGPHPALIVLHEWNAGTPKAGFLLCKTAARAGVAALFVTEPYSLARQARGGSDAHILSGNVPAMRSALRQAVLDARRGLDYLAQRPDIDPNRLGVAGISLGGVLSGITAGADPRVKVLLTVVAGSDFARGFWNGLLTRRYRGEIRRRGYTFESFRAAMSPFDAGDWLPARHLDPDDVLMINGRYDLVIAPKQAEMLAGEAGGAHIVWANAGHYGVGLGADRISALGVAFLRARFFGETAGFHRPDTIWTPTLKLGLLLGGQEGVSPVVATPIINFDRAGVYTLDGQLTLHGLSLAPSVRLGPVTSLGVEFPLFHGRPKPRPFIGFTITL